jgi:hypothetical protein
MFLQLQMLHTGEIQSTLLDLNFFVSLWGSVLI